MGFSSAKSARVLRGNSPSHNWISSAHSNVFLRELTFCIQISNGYNPDTDPGCRWVWLKSEVSDFLETMENDVDSIQIIVKLTYNGNTLTVMGSVHYLDSSLLFSENKSYWDIADIIFVKKLRDCSFGSKNFTQKNA